MYHKWLLDCCDCIRALCCLYSFVVKLSYCVRNPGFHATHKKPFKEGPKLEDINYQLCLDRGRIWNLHVYFSDKEYGNPKSGLFLEYFFCDIDYQDNGVIILSGRKKDFHILM